MIKKKIVKIVAISVVIFFLGGIGGFVFDRYFAPFLGSCKFLSNFEFLQGSGKNTTIIKETERIVIKDDNSINELAAGATQSVVDIIALSGASISSSFIKKSEDRGGKRGVGTMLTNDGVVITHSDNVFENDTAEYSVVVFDGTIFEADLMGVDDFTELAFLKIKDGNFSAIPFSNSDDVIVGKKIIIIGGSIGDQQVSIAEGILSDYDKLFNLAGVSLASSEKLEGVFKSSFIGGDNYVGGPVIDYNGELVAITSMRKIDNKKEYFQIPANEVKSSMNKVFSEDIDKSAKLGVYYVSIDNFYAILNDLPISEGAMIYSASGNQGLAVIANSAAAKAGIKINDMITAVDGHKIDLSNSLSSYINRYEVGDRVKFNILRGGEELTIEVVF